MGASCGLRVQRLVCLRLDPNENGAPEGVKLSRAGALGAARFAFEALDRGLRPELCDELLDAAAESAREDALLLRQGRGREVAVAIDLGPACRRLEELKVISPAAKKSTLGWLRAANCRSRMRASSPMARWCATKLKQRLAVDSFGTPVTDGPHGDASRRAGLRRAAKRAMNRSARGGRLVVVVVFDGMVFEGRAFVEFGERNREADLRHLEAVVILEDKGTPSVLDADEDGRAYALLLEHDVSLDGGRRLVLAGLDDAVLGGGARTQHLKDDNGVIDHFGGSIDGGAHHHSVWIADMVVGDLDLEIAPIKLTGLTSQPAAKSYGEIPLDYRMASGAAGHRDGLEAIEFVAQFLPLLPWEEFGERHWLVRPEVHGRQSSTVAHEGLPWLWLTVSRALTMGSRRN